MFNKSKEICTIIIKRTTVSLIINIYKNLYVMFSKTSIFTDNQNSNTYYNYETQQDLYFLNTVLEKYKNEMNYSNYKKKTIKS